MKTKMSLLLALLLLFLMFGRSFACKEEKFIIKKQLRQSYYSYEVNKYIDSQNVTANSTIVCSNINYTLQEITFPYQKQEYEQFLKIVNSNLSELLPLKFSQFSTITKLYLSALQIERILPGAFSGLTRLRELYLNDNELTEVSNGVYNNLHRLEILNLTNNKIYHIESFSLMGTAKLEHLFLKQNNFSVIEDGALETLHRLKYLDVSKNPLQEFPFSDLPNIETLILAETELTSLDQDLSNLTMKLMNLSNCQLSRVDFSLFPKSDKVDLSNNKIKEVENCQSLDTLDIKLDNNQIKKIGGNFGGTSRLDLSHNKFETLSAMFGDPTSILYLNFSYNEITKIENSFFRNMTTLTILNLRHNNITQIYPVLFRDLTRLTILDLSENQIENFQFGVFDTLSSLEILNISSNKLLDLQLYTFNSLSNLRSLFFDNNRISSFDVVHLEVYLPSLSTISLDHNPWDCKKLVRTEKYLRSRKIKVLPGYSYDVENFQGISCSNPKDFVISSNTSVKEISQNFQKILNEGVKNSKMDRFFNEDFDKSKFVKYFDNGYSQSNFFKYLDNYKFAMVNQKKSNDSKTEKLTGLQVTPAESNNKVVIFGVVILCLILLLLGFNVYLNFNLMKNSQFNYKPDTVSQLELC